MERDRRFGVGASSREGAESATRDQAVARHLCGFGGHVQFLEAGGTRDPGSRLCRRAHVARRVPGSGGGRRPLPTVQRPVRGRVAGRTSHRRAVGALQRRAGLGGGEGTRCHRGVELRRSAVSPDRGRAFGGVPHPGRADRAVARAECGVEHAAPTSTVAVPGTRRDAGSELRKLWGN